MGLKMEYTKKTQLRDLAEALTMTKTACKTKCTAMDNMGVSLTATPSTATLWLGDKILAKSKELNHTSLNMALAKKLKTKSAVSTVQSAYQHLIDTAFIVVCDEHSPPDNEAGTTAEQKLSFAVGDDFPDFDAPRVALKDATKLRQPVHGTDSDSRYFVVALGEGVNVAARMKGPENHGLALSVRVEGVNASGYADALMDVGFAKSSAGHWSLHLGSGDDLLTRKTLGSILFALGIPFARALTDVRQLYNKGA